MRALVIVGTGDYALVARQLLARQGRHRIVAFSEERAFLARPEVDGLPNLPFEELASRFPPQETELLVAVGPNRVNTVRARLYEAARAQGFRFATYISPGAHVWDPGAVGENSFVFPGCVIEPFATIGSDCVLWSGAIVAHHAAVGDHCFLGPGAAVSGRTRIGANTFIGINATVRDNLVVGERCIIGGGAVIKSDCEPGGVYSATPTRLRNRNSLDTRV